MTKTTTAQRILARIGNELRDVREAQGEARDLAVKATNASCTERTYHFYDGSALSFNCGEVQIVDGESK